MISAPKAQQVRDIGGINAAAEAPAAAHAPPPASVLPAPDAVSGDPVAMLAKLFVKSAQSRRESNDVAAKAADQAEDAADARQIEAMREKADHDMQAGLVAGGSQIASGAATIGSGIAKGPEASAAWAGAGKVLEGAGKIRETGWKDLSSTADRGIEKAKHDSKVAKRSSDALHKEIDAATQHQGKVIQLMQEIKQAQAQCQRALLLRA